MKLLSFLAILSAMITTEAYANSTFIPNHYRNRREINTGSALGWSDRREAGINYGQGDSEESGSTSDEKDESTVIVPYVFSRFPNNFNLEFSFSRANYESTEIATGDQDETDMDILQMGGGYEFSEVPMVLAASLIRAQYDFGGTDSDATHSMLALGYRLPSQVYLGASITHVKSEVVSTDDNDTLYKFGGGYVLGDLTNPDGALEAVFGFYNEEGVEQREVKLNGLLNYETLQPYASISHATRKGNLIKDTTFIGEIGVDYIFLENFYVGPEFGVYRSKDEDSDKTNTSLWSLEAGYRDLGKHEAFLRVNNVSTKYDNSDILTSDYTDKGTSWILGGALFF